MLLRKNVPEVPESASGGGGGKKRGGAKPLLVDPPRKTVSEPPHLGMFLPPFHFS